MKPPPGFEQGVASRVCRLRKSFYGLKKAPHCWFAKLAESLCSCGFTNFYSDYSLFRYVRGDVRLHVLIYVVDLIISGNNSAVLSVFKAFLSSYFHTKDLDVLKYFLGIEVAHSFEGIYLCQRKYVLDIITECGLLGRRPASFPLNRITSWGSQLVRFLRMASSTEPEAGSLECCGPGGALGICDLHALT
ncbi:transmembrane signal receptor [Lithospermum erythrorhizon]|uniref:Transmembrane signal receptor n=1 Tax=Lithospermum erythrorhizon TaxID=34254 RepID=A0AAV3PIM2_LITER